MPSEVHKCCSPSMTSEKARRRHLISLLNNLAPSAAPHRRRLPARLGLVVVLLSVGIGRRCLCPGVVVVGMATGEGDQHKLASRGFLLLASLADKAAVELKRLCLLLCSTSRPVGHFVCTLSVYLEPTTTHTQPLSSPQLNSAILRAGGLSLESHAASKAKKHWGSIYCTRFAPVCTAACCVSNNTTTTTMAAPTSSTHKDFAAGQGLKRVARAWNEEEAEEEEEEEYDDDEAWHDAEEETTSTTHAALPCRRPLGGFEQFMYKAHQMGCGLIYMVAELECQGRGPAAVLPLPDSRMVEQALRPIIARHPNLRACITANGEQLEILPIEEVKPAAWVVPFVTTKGGEGGGGGGVVGFVKEELKRTPIALGRYDGPFWQLFLVQEDVEKGEEGGREGGVKQSLVVMAHHSIMDGESVVVFLKEVVAGVEGLLRQEASKSSKSSSSSSGNEVGKEQPSASALDFLPSQDELFETVLPPMPGDGPRGALAFLWRRVTWYVSRGREFPVCADFCISSFVCLIVGACSY